MMHMKATNGAKNGGTTKEGATERAITHGMKRSGSKKVRFFFQFFLLFVRVCQDFSFFLSWQRPLFFCALLLSGANDEWYNQSDKKPEVSNEEMEIKLAKHDDSWDYEGTFAHHYIFFFCATLILFSLDLILIFNVPIFYHMYCVIS